MTVSKKNSSAEQISVTIGKRPACNPALHRIVKHTAAKMGRSEYEIGLTLSFLFEGIANAMIDGEVIKVDGFGMFGTKWRVRNNQHHPDKVTRVYPAFSGCKTMRRILFFTKRPSDASMMDKRMYTHSTTSTMLDERGAKQSVSEIHTHLRNGVRKQGARLGIVLPPE